MNANFHKYIELIFSFPVFVDLDESQRTLLINTIVFRRISAGTRLTIDDEISSDIIIPINGNIRPMALLNNKLISHSRQGVGCIVGLASILNMRHCEDCIATEDMDIGVIDEKIFLKLYADNKYVKIWCDSHLWPQEVMQLVGDILIKYPKPVDIGPKILNEIVRTSVLVEATQMSVAQALDSGFQLHVSSGINNIQAGSIITLQSIPQTSSNFPVRIIGIRPELLGLDKISLNTHETQSDGFAVDEYNETNNKTHFSPARSRFETAGLVPQDFKLVRGKGALNEALACIRMISNILQLPFRKDAVVYVLQQALDSSNEINLRIIGDIFSGMGLLVSGISVECKYLFRASVPSLFRIKDELVVLISSNQHCVVIASPQRGILSYNHKEVLHTFSEKIEILLLERKYNTPSKKFGLSWFLPLLKKYRQFIAQTFFSSFIIQLLILCNPLVVQVIIDKVINQQSLDSLQVLGIALVVITIVEGVLSTLKTFLFTDTTNKIDQRLGAEIVDHLLRLPLSYFDKRPVGDLSSRLGELQKIRDFLLGQGLSTFLDAIFCIIYIGIMLVYSLKLTSVALAVVPIQIVLTLVGAPIYRKLLRNSTHANAKTQSFMVEMLTGIGTIKSQNIELKSRSSWQDLYATYISRSFEKTIVGTFIVQCSQSLQKLSQLLVLWMGAILVLDGQLTLGQLIAFRIISGYVTQPLLRVSGFWQNIQELNVSLDRLSDIVDYKQESNLDDIDMLQMPKIDGKISIRSLSFFFPDSSLPALNDVNLDIEPGMFVAIVGHSGSGKSTLVKMISRLYLPTSGDILIDDYDINKVELYSLRRQLGLVSQEPLLFAGSIRENIAISAPNASETEIVNAAKLSYAHGFIQDLPLGYSTRVGERGLSLSGGQRQRISIARTLLTKPRMLIFDEATSALDYPTEKIICQNLSANFSDITTLFVTHRLEAIREADLILVMENGALKEYGTHDYLMSLGNLYYSLCQSRQG